MGKFKENDVIYFINWNRPVKGKILKEISNFTSTSINYYYIINDIVPNDGTKCNNIIKYEYELFKTKEELKEYFNKMCDDIIN